MPGKKSRQGRNPAATRGSIKDRNRNRKYISNPAQNMPEVEIIYFMCLLYSVDPGV
jgi:hypothetical protein